MVPLIANLGPPELLIVFGILILLFGANKLPELARGTGRALRIFKSETRALEDETPTVVRGAGTIVDGGQVAVDRDKSDGEPGGTRLNPADDA